MSQTPPYVVDQKMLQKQKINIDLDKNKILSNVIALHVVSHVNLRYIPSQDTVRLSTVYDLTDVLCDYRAPHVKQKIQVYSDSDEYSTAYVIRWQCACQKFGSTFTCTQ